MGGMPEMVFEIESANVWRGDNLALRDFTLRMRRGGHMAILGPNGAGKSTFLKLLTGEVRPAAEPQSVCRLSGEELWSLEEIRHRIGVVMPEEVSRFTPWELGRDVVLSSLRGAYGRTRDMRFSRQEKAKTEDAMRHLGVAALGERPFAELSSGERRRLLIARALVHDPEVLVLDEPSTALDFAAGIRLIATLRELAASGRDILMVTHHPGEIPPEIERVVILRGGRVFADGPKRRVLTSEAVTKVYGVPLAVRWSGGWCDVRPA